MGTESSKDGMGMGNFDPFVLVVWRGEGFVLVPRQDDVFSPRTIAYPGSTIGSAKSFGNGG
jgi:hypothetical protein